MRQRFVLPVAMSLWVACGSPRRADQDTAPSSPPPSGHEVAAQPVDPPVGPLDPSMPSGAMLRAAIDPAALEGWLGRIGARVDPALAAQLADLFGVDAQTIRGGHIASAFGLDPSRSIQLAIAPLDAAAMGDVENLRRLIAAHEAQPGDRARIDALEQAMGGPHAARIAIRAAVPTVDASHLLELLRLALHNAEWPRIDPPDGVEDLFASPDAQGALAVSRAPGVVVLDVILDPFAEPSHGDHPPQPFADRMRAMAGAMRRRAPGGPHGEPLATQTDMLRVEFQPVPIAAMNFMLGIGAVSHALAAVDPAHREAIGLQGLHEASQSFFVTSNERGAYFDRIALGVHDDPSVSIQADLGPGATIPEPAAWAPTPSVQQVGGAAQLDLSTVFLRAWNLPGDSADATAESRFRLAEREAGGLAIGFAFPFALIDALRHSMDQAPRPFPIASVARQRFERYSVVTRGASAGHPPVDVYVGLLPANIDANGAACVLAPDGTPCTPALRLTVDRTITRDAHAVRLTRVGHRFALMVSQSAPALAATHLEPTPAPVAPARFVLDVMAVSQGDPLAALFPGVFVGEVSRTASQITFTVHPTH